MAARQRGPDPEHRARLAQLDDRAGRVASPDRRGGYDHVGKALSTTATTTSCGMPPTDTNVQLEADHWISLRNWNRLVAHPPAPALRAAARHVRAASTARCEWSPQSTPRAGRRSSRWSLVGPRRSRRPPGPPIGSSRATPRSGDRERRTDHDRPARRRPRPRPGARGDTAVYVFHRGRRRQRRWRRARAPHPQPARPDGQAAATGTRGSSDGRTVTLVKWRRATPRATRLSPPSTTRPTAAVTGESWPTGSRPARRASRAVCSALRTTGDSGFASATGSTPW